MTEKKTNTNIFYRFVENEQYFRVNWISVSHDILKKRLVCATFKVDSLDLSACTVCWYLLAWCRANVLSFFPSIVSALPYSSTYPFIHGVSFSILERWPSTAMQALPPLYQISKSTPSEWVMDFEGILTNKDKNTIYILIQINFLLLKSFCVQFPPFWCFKSSIKQAEAEKLERIILSIIVSVYK